MKGRTVEGRNPVRNDLLELRYQDDGDDDDDNNDDDANHGGEGDDPERMAADTVRLWGTCSVTVS